jgi:hypothetical protein
MIYYGGCDVKWSNYVVTDNTLSDIATKTSTKNACLNPNSDAIVLAPFFDQAKYINYMVSGGDPYITFYG